MTSAFQSAVVDVSLSRDPQMMAEIHSAVYGFRVDSLLSEAELLKAEFQEVVANADIHTVAATTMKRQLILTASLFHQLMETKSTDSRKLSIP